MATTINVLCYRSKTLKNGEHPLMLCICKDRARKYTSLNLSVKAKHWNFDKNEPKPNCPNIEHICPLIASKKAEYEKEAIKSSYIDSYVKRGINATEVTVGISRALQGDSEYSWFLG